MSLFRVRRIRVRRTVSIGGVTAVVLLAAAMASTSTVVVQGDLAEIKGIATEVLDFEAEVLDLPEWSFANAWLGLPHAGSVYPTQSLAVDGEGRIYACVSGYDASTYTTTTADLSTAIGTPAGKVRRAEDGSWAKLREKSGLDVTRMTFPDAGTVTLNMSIRVTVEFKEPAGNDDSFHVFLVDADTGDVYDAPDYPLFAMRRDASESNTYTLSPRYPLIGRDVDVVCEIRRGASDAANTSKVIVRGIEFVDRNPDGGSTGIVAYDPGADTWTTVHQRSYGYDGSASATDAGRFQYQPVLSVILAPVSTDLYDAGDLLFLQVKSDEVWGWPLSRSEVWAISPDADGDDEATLVASADLNSSSSNGGALTLGVLDDGTLILGGSRLYRLDYDASLTPGEYATEAELIVGSEVFASVVGPDGETVHAAVRSGNEKEVLALDPFDATAGFTRTALLTDHVGQTRGLVFDSAGTLWWGGRKPNATGASKFLGKPRGAKDKINYKRRLVEWTSGVRTIVAGLDGNLYVLTRDANDTHRVWQVKP